jgi:transcriptional regulator with PAS, ATPase and Fis domain
VIIADDLKARASGRVAVVEVEERNGFSGLVGRCPRFDETIQRARVLTRVDSPVLLQGETGVGKELFARAIHESGRSREGPFIALNCGGLPRELLASELFGYADGAFTGARRSGCVGKIEAAQGGTLFLDEVSELPLDLQPYLLRVLEGGEIYPLGSTKPRVVQFRLVAACNRDVRAEVRAGRFRADLFYRISVTSLHVPALRERCGDLPLLVDHFARRVAERHGARAKTFAPDVLLVFARYAWPGNLRELRNVVEAMVFAAEGDVIDRGALPSDFPPSVCDAPQPEGATVRALGDLEREVIGSTLELRKGNLTRAAKDLGISRSTLYLKVKRYGLHVVLAQIRVGARPT